MGQEKTTKQVLEEKLAGRERVPLYNPEALKKLSQEFDQWKNTAVREEDRKN